MNNQKQWLSDQSYSSSSSSLSCWVLRLLLLSFFHEVQSFPSRPAPRRAAPLGSVPSLISRSINARHHDPFLLYDSSSPVDASSNSNNDDFAQQNKNSITPFSSHNPLTVRRILQFSISAMGIGLCNPLLSLIDTSAVGMISGTVQQAALNPAVAVTDYSARMMYFLYTGTTNLVAGTFENDRHDPTKTETVQTLEGVLRLSLRVGTGLMILLLVGATTMIQALIGSSPEAGVLSAAQKYVWIRALSMPASAMIGSMQAACLGMQDVKSPLLVTLVAALVNLVVDLVLVRHSHVWIGGTAGAAWATTFSQYFAVTLYLQWLWKGSIPGSERIKSLSRYVKSHIRFVSRRGESTNAVLNSPAQTSNQKMARKQQRISSTSSSSVRGILKGRRNLRNLMTRNSEGETVSVAEQYSPYVIPVTTTQIGRCSVYVAMSKVVSGMSVINMAANQILNSFFYALIPIADALSQTAQALLPPLFPSLEKENKENVQALSAGLSNFWKAALYFGGALTGIVSCIPWLTRHFMSSDPMVQGIVGSVVPIHMLIFSLHGVFCAAEGILLAQKDLKYLGRMYGLYFVVVPTLMVRLKHSLGASMPLKAVWALFMGYQLFRITAWVGRVVFLLQKRRKVAATAATYKI